MSELPVKKPLLKSEAIFPLLVAILSIVSIYNYRTDPLVLVNLVSLTGLAGVVLYFLGKQQYRKLIYIWIILQVLVIERTFIDEISGSEVTEPIWNMSQAYNVRINWSIQRGNSTLALCINVLPFVYFALLKVLELSGVVGKRLSFLQFRSESDLADIFPLHGTVLKRLTLSNEKEWFLVGLDTPFEYDGSTVGQVIVKNKDGDVVKPRAKNQIVYFRLVRDPADVEPGNNDPVKFPFVDWAICK